METKEHYMKEAKEDLVVRLLHAQLMGHFLLFAYDTLRSYSVNFKDLPEWKDMKTLDDARRLKPQAAHALVTGWFEKLENALRAAIRRKQFRDVNKGGQ